MGSTQYPGSYGNSMTAFNQAQAPNPNANASMYPPHYAAPVQQSYPPAGYMPRRHTIQNDARSVITCFRYGQTGHYSPECINPPLPIMEQQEVRRWVGEDQIEKIRVQLGFCFGGGAQVICGVWCVQPRSRSCLILVLVLILVQNYTVPGPLRSRSRREVGNYRYM